MAKPSRAQRPVAARNEVTRRRLGVGRLEDRTLPAVMAAVVDGTLLVTTSQVDDRVEQIRVIGEVAKGDSGEIAVVRVFDGKQEVGAFSKFTNISIQPSGDSTTSVALNQFSGIDTLSIRVADAGANAIQIGPGAVNALAVSGGAGDEVIDVNGLTANTFDADTGLGADAVRIASGAFKRLDVRSAEAVALKGPQVGDVTLDNRDGTMTVDSAADLGSLRVFTGTGTLNLGGSVAGDVTFTSFGIARDQADVPGAALRLSGQVGGTLRMTGSSLDDSAEFTSESRVAGNVEVSLGAGTDRVTLAGEIGDGSTALFIDLGAGDDSVALLDSAALMAGKALIELGEGNDTASVAAGARSAALTIDGGDGKDTLETKAAEGAFDQTGFETIS